MYVVQPDQVVVVQQQSGGVEDELRGCPGQLLQSLAGQVQGVWVTDRAEHCSGVLTRHLAHLDRRTLGWELLSGPSVYLAVLR